MKLGAYADPSQVYLIKRFLDEKNLALDVYREIK